MVVVVLGFFFVLVGVFYLFVGLVWIFCVVCILLLFTELRVDIIFVTLLGRGFERQSSTVNNQEANNFFLRGEFFHLSQANPQKLQCIKMFCMRCQHFISTCHCCFPPVAEFCCQLSLWSLYWGPFRMQTCWCSVSWEPGDCLFRLA